MIPAIVVFIYLAIVAYIGSVAYRRGKENTEDFFLASRTIGPMVFFLSIFATNMTAFAWPSAKIASKFPEWRACTG